jgi:hypothetical protein
MPVLVLFLMFSCAQWSVVFQFESVLLFPGRCVISLMRLVMFMSGVAHVVFVEFLTFEVLFRLGKGSISAVGTSLSVQGWAVCMTQLPNGQKESSGECELYAVVADRALGYGWISWHLPANVACPMMKMLPSQGACRKPMMTRIFKDKSVHKEKSWEEEPYFCLCPSPSSIPPLQLI